MPRIVAVALLSAALLAGAAGGASAALGAPSTTICESGSGPDLAGRHIDAATLTEVDSLACADLTGADLRGLNLIQQDLTGIRAARANLADTRLGQADLTGAVLSGADLKGADLTQATLTAADLAGADATGADFGQVHAERARFTGATVTDAIFIQATLTGADFDGATMGGADFTQADTDGASFVGAHGLLPWSRYLLIASLAVFLLAASVAVRRALCRRRTVESIGTAPVGQPAMAGYPDTSWATPAATFGTPTGYGGNGFQPINAPAPRSVGRGIAVGLLAAALIAFGFHLAVGALIGVFSFAFDTLATVTCAGPTCAVGIDAGMLGIWGGIFVLMAGFWVLAKA